MAKIGELELPLSLKEAELVLRCLRKEAVVRRTSLERAAVASIIYRLEKKVETTPVKYVTLQVVSKEDEP